MSVHSIGTFEAKNKLSHLLDLVEAGEEIIITRNGKPVAKLIAAEIKTDRKRAREAVRKIREMRKGQSLGGLSIKELVNEGRH